MTRQTDADLIKAERVFNHGKEWLASTHRWTSPRTNDADRLKAEAQFNRTKFLPLRGE